MNGDRKIRQLIRITNSTSMRMRKWGQFSQIIKISTKVITTEKVYTDYISTISHGFKRSTNPTTSSSTFKFL